MPDARSPIRHHLALYQRDPEQSRTRFFSLIIERDLFGTTRLVWNWGVIGFQGQEKNDTFLSGAEAARVLEGWADTSGKRATPARNVVGRPRAAADRPFKPGDG
jgi:predicted DNA-binding WGR domain protein